MGEIDPVTEHVAQFAGARELLLLAPANAPRAPILEPAGAVVVRLAEVAALDEMVQVTHRGNEPVGESRHVADPRGVGHFGHALGVGGIERKRFFAEHVLARARGGDGDGRMEEIRRRDDDGVDVVARDDVLPARRSDGRAGLLAGGFQRGWMAVAQGGDADFLAQGKAWQVVLEGDPAAADEGKVELAYVKS